MTLDSKTILTNQKIEQDRKNLLKKLLEERYGISTREGDESTQILVGMDLTPLIQDDSLSVLEFTRQAIHRFEESVCTALSPYFSK